MFPSLFSPITINKTEIKNRIVYPALGLLYSYDGKLNDRYYGFFRERAAGGAGIVTVGPVGVDYLGASVVALSLASDDAIPPFKKLTGLIRSEGARAWVQLFHAGAYMHPFLIDGRQALAPSAVYSKYSKSTPKEMTLGDIHAVQDAFMKAAERAREADFDGVEIIGSAGYLITQFLSPLKNLRTDEYGGSFENRARFAREIIAMIRKNLGKDYPVTIRMAGNDFVPGSNTDLDAPEIAKMYEAAGIDAISVTGGWHETRVPQLPMVLPRGGFSYLAHNIKKTVGVPVMSSNRISDPDTAEEIIRDGIADMVCLGRALIADPYWPRKAREGKIDEIRPCVSCNQGCADELFNGRPVFCLANPRAGFEGERNITTAHSPKKVMVIGAGPAGLEAAVTAAQIGHRVEIYEKTGDIGGQLWIAGTPPHKQELWEIVRYYDAMLEKYNIPVHLETEVDIDFIKKKKPDHVIAAEGAVPVRPKIDGIDDPKVFDAWDVLEHDPPLGRKIAVIGGGAVGLETAEFLASKGTISPETLHFLFKYEAESVGRLRELITRGTKEVTVFELLPKAGKGIGKSTKWILLESIEKLGIAIITEANILSVKNAEVVFEKAGAMEKMAFDSVVAAIGAKPLRKVADAIKDSGIPHTVVGDSVRPARMNDAIHEGFLAALAIK